MNINKNDLQVAANNLAANVKEIDNLRNKVEGTDLKEAAQLLLMEKYDLSQTEAAEIVEELQGGMTQYRTTYSAMVTDREGTVRESLEKAVSAMNEAERVRYLASMLSALQLAATKADADQAEIDNLLNANLEKTEAELTEAIIVSLDTLPVEALSEAAQELSPEALKGVAEAIDRNSGEYRFMAALQLYMMNREGNFKTEDETQTLSPRLIGALACGAIDALVATSDLQGRKIELKQWQHIIKIIAGALFMIASGCLVALGMLALTLPVMSMIWSFLGTGFFATLLIMVIMVPVIQYGVDKVADSLLEVLERLSPIYDRFIVKATAFFKSMYEKISTWIKKRYQTVRQAMTRDKAEEETARIEMQEEQEETVREEGGLGANAPLPA